MKPEDFFKDKRTFKRQPFKLNASMTPLTGTRDDSGAIDGTTGNLSAGGILFESHYDHGDSTYFLVELDSDDEFIPKFVIGRIKWTEKRPDDFNIESTYSGVEFIIIEELTMDGLMSQFGDVPPEVYEFDESTRSVLDRYLKSRASRHTDHDSDDTADPA